MKICLLIIISCLFLSSCSEINNQQEPTNNAPTVTEDKIIETQNVSDSIVVINESPEPFIVEIDTSELEVIYVGPTRQLKSLEEVFDSERDNIHVIIDEGIYTSEFELYVEGYNIILEGAGKVELQCKELYRNVMWIMGKGIIIRNLHLTHFKPGASIDQNCSGRVIGLEGASEVLIENCDINGCGLVGIHDNMNNSRVHIKNNYIHYNSLGPFGDIDGKIWMEEFEGHPVFTFENNRIENNGEDRVPEYQDTLYYANYSIEQAIEIDSLLTNWNNNGRSICYKKHKVNHNCNDCESTTLEVVFGVNSRGEIDIMNVSKDQIRCLNGDKKELLKRDMIESFINELSFSSAFMFKVVKMRIGTTLKC